MLLWLVAGSVDKAPVVSRRNALAVGWWRRLSDRQGSLQGVWGDAHTTLVSRCPLVVVPHRPECSPCVVNIANIATARHYYSTDIMKIPQGAAAAGSCRRRRRRRLGAHCRSCSFPPCTCFRPDPFLPRCSCRPGQRVRLGRCRAHSDELPRHSRGLRGAGERACFATLPLLR